MIIIYNKQTMLDNFITQGCWCADLMSSEFSEIWLAVKEHPNIKKENIYMDLRVFVMISSEYAQFFTIQMNAESI